MLANDAVNFFVCFVLCVRISDQGKDERL
jgi:hypothetical protein